MKQMIKETFVMIVACVMAYVAFGYAGRVYAQHKVAKAMAESVRMNDSIEANTDRTIVLPQKQFGGRRVVTAEVSGYEYDVIFEMYREAMQSRELREDFRRAFPIEYGIMMRDGENHNCIECRLKAIAAAYDDAVWADMFDDCNEEDITYQFEDVLRHNHELRKQFQAIVKSVWGA